MQCSSPRCKALPCLSAQILASAFGSGGNHCDNLHKDNDDDDDVDDDDDYDDDDDDDDDDGDDDDDDDDGDDDGDDDDDHIFRLTRSRLQLL